MWTDEQLRSQGWTDEQIAIHRSEETANINPASLVEQPSISQQSEPHFSETLGIPKANVKSTLDGLNMPAILMATLLVLVPFSLYSISNAEGKQGPSGENGASGMNGSDGSSFHLVTSIDTLPRCDSSINNQIFFIASEASFQVCQGSIWAAIDLTGQSGTDGKDGLNGNNGTDGSNGTDGEDGQNGESGQNGADGSDGSDGNDGLSSLIVTRNEPSGTNCPNGGTLVETGVDDNGDNSLSVSEVDSFVFVCDGVQGLSLIHI